MGEILLWYKILFWYKVSGEDFISAKWRLCYEGDFNSRQQWKLDDEEEEDRDDNSDKHAEIADSKHSF